MTSAEVFASHDEVIHVELDDDVDMKASTIDFALDLLTPGGGYVAPGDKVVAAADVNYYNVEALFQNGVVEVDHVKTEQLRQSHLALAAGGAALS